MPAAGKRAHRLRRPDFRDAAVVVASAAVAALLSSALELNERVFRLTRRLELYQLDELPYVLIVLSIGLGWLAFRRHRRLLAEIDAHVATEARLQEALLDNRRLAAERLQAEEQERKRLARDLHDELGQYLSLIRLDALQIDLGAPDSANRRHAESIKQGVEQLQRAVRSMMSELRPVALDDLGLSAALEHCLSTWRERAAPMRFHFSSTGDLDSLPEAVALAIYRVIQEGLTNAVRHSGGAQVFVDLRVGRGEDGAGDVQIRLADDGRGLQGEPGTGSRGLRGMRERIELADGTLCVSRSPEGGVELRVNLPYVADR